jgi:DNA-binding NtrC family response regulator
MGFNDTDQQRLAQFFRRLDQRGAHLILSNSDPKNENPDVVTILLTAYGNIPIAVEAMKYGAYDYIHKPINIDELDISVNKVADALKLKNSLSIYLNDQKIQL